MSTTTIDTHDYPIRDSAVAKAGPPRKGVINRLIEARIRKAESYTRSFLLRQTDRGLADLGFTAEQIREIRDTGRMPASHWR